jgi:hypothetical protein
MDKDELAQIIIEYMAGNPNHFMYIVLNNEGDTSHLSPPTLLL